MQGGRRWGPPPQGQEPRAQSGSNVVASSVKTFESGPHPPQQKKVKRKQNWGGGNHSSCQKELWLQHVQSASLASLPRAGLPGCGLPCEPGPPSLLSQHLWARGPGSCFDELSRLTLLCVENSGGSSLGGVAAPVSSAPRTQAWLWPWRMGPGGV